MSLVRYANIDKLPEDVRNALGHAPVRLNIFKMFANAETCFIRITRLGGAILGRQQLDAKLHSMAILVVVGIAGGEYEWEQHVPIAIAVGANQARVDAIAKRKLDASCFDDLERAILRFTEEVGEKVRADEAVVKGAMKSLSPREIVELIMTIGFYLTAARITETTRTDPDPPADTRVMDAIRGQG